MSLGGLGTAFREVVPDFFVVISNHFEGRLGMDEARWDGWRVSHPKLLGDPKQILPSSAERSRVVHKEYKNYIQVIDSSV